MDKRRGAAELQREKRDRERKRAAIFGDVLSKVYSRITAKAALNWVRMVYEVPRYVVGMPLYDVAACVRYLCKHLRGNGYMLEVYEPNVLYISWDREETEAAADQGTRAGQGSQTNSGVGSGSFNRALASLGADPHAAVYAGMLRSRFQFQ
jgi:hypothetical protein